MLNNTNAVLGKTGFDTLAEEKTQMEHYLVSGNKGKAREGAK